MISAADATPLVRRAHDSFRAEQGAGNRYPIREIFRRFYPQYEEDHPELPEYRRRVARMISMCKTGELGYTVSVCEECGSVHVHNASCNSRSCPCCQYPQERKWVAQRRTELIGGIAYYHVVFTVPHELNPLIAANERTMLGLMLKSAADTLLSLCSDRRYMGARPAVLCVLHTWGQKLNYHPHVHVCLSGGGLAGNVFKETRHKGFIIPHKVAARSFKGRFLSSLKKLHDSGSQDLSLPDSLKDPECWKEFIGTLFSREWLPFLKETFNGNGNAVEYLGRYSYRTAISNSRIVRMDGDSVTFRYKDYADGSAQKTMTVKGTEFIGLFLQHVLPNGFSRIRYAGLLANGRRTSNLKLVHKLRSTVYPGNPYRHMGMRELMLDLFGKDIACCSLCGGHMLVIENRIRGRPAPRKPSHSPMTVPAMC